MPGRRSLPLLLTGAFMFLACQSKELDTKVLDDPLDDPWVAGIGTEGGAVVEANVAAPTEPTPAELAGEVAAASEPADTPAVADAGAPAGEATGTPSAAANTPSAHKSAPATTPTPTEGQAIAASEPVPSETPTLEPQPANVEPAPAVTPEPTKPAEPPPITLADFHGSYRYTGGTAQREALDAAIEETLLQLNAAIRGIGRKRLIKTNPIDDNVQLVVNGDDIQTIFSVSGFDAECTVGAPAISYTGKSGSKYKVRVVQQGSKLVQVIVGEDGTKTSVFVLSSDRQRLTINHKITSDRLEIPMTYKLSFTRK